MCRQNWPATLFVLIIGHCVLGKNKSATSESVALSMKPENKTEDFISLFKYFYVWMFHCWWPCGIPRIKIKPKFNQSDSDLKFSSSASTNVHRKPHSSYRKIRASYSDLSKSCLCWRKRGCFTKITETDLICQKNKELHCKWTYLEFQISL